MPAGESTLDRIHSWSLVQHRQERGHGEFHRNDDAPVNLMEMRFHMPISESADTDPVEAFQEQVMKQTSVIFASGDAIAIFRKIHCLTPRGTTSRCSRASSNCTERRTTLRSRPRQYCSCSCCPKRTTGTRYCHFVGSADQAGPDAIPLLGDAFTDKELKDKYEDKLTMELSVPVYEVLDKIMNRFNIRKLTGVHLPLKNSGCRMLIELKTGTFSSIEKLFDFISSKKLNVKNTDKNAFKQDFANSDNENEPDAYLVRVKAEAKKCDDDDSKESTDEVFSPNQVESLSRSKEDSEGGGGGRLYDEAKKELKEKKK
ncbi:FACT complex subunit Ssrp1 [Culex quinquefasciatus]|uniref:FACT complex subunit Ssrp1 n=1 Tax=Culex quinquefasciatus TaxID=7176 RepID=B0XC20_CULQU|nr:FACT complex subunit Ssrp1 [Culex quinquefasciatus]|eukprot:XP_001867192.1 FACT complex subunit Ssrp1 [Culex quinquefasciatus]